MSKPQPGKVQMFVALRKWKDGSEQVIEYFDTRLDALLWIKKQKKPRGDEFQWCVGEY